MKEIGGYLELETFEGQEYYEGDHIITLDCARNCLAFLISLRKYEKVYLPDYACASVREGCEKAGASIEWYSIGKDFQPVFQKSLSDKEALYLIDYYGQITPYIRDWKQRYPNLILDCVQDFFYKAPDDVDAVYSCRKFFGVPDGAYLHLGKMSQTEQSFCDGALAALEMDISYDRMGHVLGRYEGKASDFFQMSIKHNSSFIGSSIKKMSALTHNLLRGVDYAGVIVKRSDNFEYLEGALGSINELQDLVIPKGAFMYPLKLSKGQKIRRCLQNLKIYVPTLWPDVLAGMPEDSVAYGYARDILPLPCDQRYDTEDMRRVCNAVREIYEKEYIDLSGKFI